VATTIRQLAEAAGVSVATVSRALSNSDHPINPETKQRILDLARRMDYRPNQVARSLRTDRSPIIGVICDDITSPFTTAIVRGIQDRLRADNYFCIVINTDWDPASEQRAIQDLAGHSIEGIIFAETSHQFANLELNIEDKKCVFVHRLFPQDYANSIVPDEVYGGHLATHHLIKLGHRRIGHIHGSQSFFSSGERLQGYRRALEEAGIAFDPALVEDGNFEVEVGYRAASKLLALPDPPTAIFAANDLMALGTIYAAHDKGLRIPDDLAIVGYDDQKIASLARPKLTTVTLPCFEMGQASAELLLAQIQQGAPLTEEIRIKGRLIVRESCGAANSEVTRPPSKPTRLEQLQAIQERKKR
jgi:DNA-binding LacI/PurR family transcriptional regulator